MIRTSTTSYHSEQIGKVGKNSSKVSFGRLWCFCTGQLFSIQFSLYYNISIVLWHFQVQLFFLPKILASLQKIFQFLILLLFLWWRLCTKYTKWVIVSCNIGQLEHSAVALLVLIHFRFSFYSEFGLHNSSTPELLFLSRPMPLLVLDE